VIAAETHLLRGQLKYDDKGAVRSIAAGIQSLQLSVRSILGRLREGQPMVLPELDAAAILDDWRRREPLARWRAESLDEDRLADLGLDEAAREALARILQEALANAFRHAQPSEVSVSLLQTPGSCELIVRNDGVRAASVGNGNGDGHGNGHGNAHGNAHGNGHGILGMIERAQNAGGSLRAGPSSTSSTSSTWEVRLVLPHACLQAAAVAQ
jgi:signal transduction histidine kinase